jgi:hypothetical protein
MLKDYFEVPNKPAIKSGNILSCDFTDHETFIPQPLDYTRGTPATYVDCNGLIKMSGVSDTELVTNGDFSNGSTDWINTDGSATFINNYVKIQSQGSTLNRIRQIDVTQVGKTFKLSYEIIENNNVSEFKYYNGTAYVTITSTVGTHTLYFVAGNNDDLFFNVADTNTDDYIIIDNVSVREVDIETPRIDYLTEIGKAKELQKPSLLLEPQSTNKLTKSEEFSNSYWTKTNCTVQRSTITSPDGLQGSYKLIPDAGTGGNRSLAKNFTGLSNDHTWSIFARAGEYKYAILRTRNNPIVVVSFDLENGTFNVNQSTAMYIADSAKMENYGNGWYRCSITLDPSEADNVGQLYPSVSVGITGNEINSFDGDGVSGIYVFGAQFEEQSYSTSYIPTSESSVTRNQDLANNAGQLGVFNSEEGVLYCEIASLSTTGSADYISISDGTNNERVIISAHNVLNTIRVFIKSGGSFYSTIDFVASNITEFQKIAFSYKSGQTKLYANGSLVGTSSDSFSLSSISSLQFANGDTTSNPYIGKVKEVKAFRRALTDAELTELTNNIV